MTYKEALAWLYSLQRFGIKLEANKRDVQYQSLIKVWLMEKLTSETSRM